MFTDVDTPPHCTFRFCCNQLFQKRVYARPRRRSLKRSPRFSIPFTNQIHRASCVTRISDMYIYATSHQLNSIHLTFVIPSSIPWKTSPPPPHIFALVILICAIHIYIYIYIIVWYSCLPAQSVRRDVNFTRREVTLIERSRYRDGTLMVRYRFFYEGQLPEDQQGHIFQHIEKASRENEKEREDTSRCQNDSSDEIFADQPRRHLSACPKSNV